MHPIDEEGLPNPERRAFAALGVLAAATVATLASPAASAQQSGERKLPRYAGPLPAGAGQSIVVSLFNFGDRPVSGSAVYLDIVGTVVLRELPIPELGSRQGFSDEFTLDQDRNVLVVLRLQGDDRFVVGTASLRRNEVIEGIFKF